MTPPPEVPTLSTQPPRRTHLRSDLRFVARSAGADSLPDTIDRPASRGWLYAPGDYESAALARVVREGHEVNRFVDYALNFARPGRHSAFRTTLAKDGDVDIIAVGRASISVDGEPRARLETAERVVLPSVSAGSVVEVVIQAVEPTGSEDQEPPTIGVRSVADGGSRWYGVGEGLEWSSIIPRASDDRAPHRRGEDEVVVALEPVADGVYALPAPMLGRVTITARGVPRLAVGESIEEASADPAHGESRTSLDAVAPGTYQSTHRLGFRFARVTGAEITSVTAHVAIRPAPRRGAFACSDPRLTSIWATSAYTLRLCMQTFLIDGIKRDRMPWAGDHALGVLTNAFSFADAGIVRDTLTALGRPRHGYANGISDYSLWWVISHGLYQRYFGDDEFLEREANHIDDFLTDLSSHADAAGIFSPADLPDGFAHSGPGSTFLDWGVTLRPDLDATAIQILWYWALSSGARLLDNAGHEGAEDWRLLATRLHDVLLERAWSVRDGVWREYLDVDGPMSAYPNFLAVLAGLAPPAGQTHRAAISDMVATGTPFMRSLALMSLGKAGHPQRAVDEIRRLWGPMIDAGALTFWEEFGADGGSPYEMYGRPFGKSLCHAWSAGPAAVLPHVILGLEPISDGWREFRIDPSLGDLDWAGALIPVPHGEIMVFATSSDLTVDVPAGSVLVHDGIRHVGPQRVELVADTAGAAL